MKMSGLIAAALRTKFFSSGYSAILAEISSPPTLTERTRNSAPK
jgi:hypothetical protein